MGHGEALVVDDLWAAIKPLLPAERRKPKVGRPRLPDRTVFTEILFILTTGSPWERLPAEMGRGSGVSCWRRLRDWQAAGVWQRLHWVLLERLEAVGVIDWSRAALDNTSLGAKRGGAEVGPNPTDRGKPGSKRHLVTDARGTPLGLTLRGANPHDSMMLAATLNAIPPIRTGQRGHPRRRPGKLHADTAYDHRRCRRECRARGIVSRIARRGIESSAHLGRRR